MIITCPSCSTRYKLADDKFPPQGRRVRCAKCGESWQQDAPEAIEPTIPPVVDAAPEPTPDPAPEPTAATEPAVDEPASESPPEPETPEFEAPPEITAAPPPPPAPAEPVPAYEPPTEVDAVEETAPPVPPVEAPKQEQIVSEPPRRPSMEHKNNDELVSPLPMMRPESTSGGRRTYLLSVILVVLILAGLAFVFRDQIASIFGGAQDGSDTTTQSDLMGAGSSSEDSAETSDPDAPILTASPLLLAISDSKIDEVGGYRVLLIKGEIQNPTDSEQPVPSIAIDLMDGIDQTLKQWSFTASITSIAPGAKETFSGQLPNPPAALQRLRANFAPLDAGDGSTQTAEP